jgi:hypothetical protein
MRRKRKEKWETFVLTNFYLQPPPQLICQKNMQVLKGIFMSQCEIIVGLALFKDIINGKHIDL